MFKITIVLCVWKLEKYRQLHSTLTSVFSKITTQNYISFHLQNYSNQCKKNLRHVLNQRTKNQLSPLCASTEQWTSRI